MKIDLALEVCTQVRAPRAHIVVISLPFSINIFGNLQVARDIFDMVILPLIQDHGVLLFILPSMVTIF